MHFVNLCSRIRKPEDFLEALKLVAELHRLTKCLSVFLRTNRTATWWPSRLWRSRRRSRSSLGPAFLLLPLHPNPAQCLQQHRGAHQHPQVSHRLLGNLLGPSYNLQRLHPQLPLQPPSATCAAVRRLSCVPPATTNFFATPVMTSSTATHPEPITRE